MDPGINRAAELWKNWESRQQEIEALTGIFTDQRKLKALKYQFLREGLFRLSVNPSDKEKLFISMISSVTAKLRSQLYPNLVLRLMHRIKVVLIEKPFYMNRFFRHKTENMDLLKVQLDRAGLSGMSGKLEHLLDYERSKISLDWVRLLKDNSKAEVTVQLEKDGYGHYVFSGYNAQLTDETGIHVCDFPAFYQLRVDEALNLLQGRSVFKSLDGADGIAGPRWISLGHTGTEAVLQSFSVDHSYSLKQLLLDHAVKLESYGMIKESVQRALEQGNSVSIQIPGKEKFYLETNPAEGKLNFFDKDKRAVDFSDVSAMVLSSKQELQKEFKFAIGKDAAQDEQMQISV